MYDGGLSPGWGLSPRAAEAPGPQTMVKVSPPLGKRLIGSPPRIGNVPMRGVPMGGNDFVFSNARKDFKNMDILFNYINKNSAKFNMKVVYSTPQDYVNTIYNNSLSPDNQIVYPDNNYDFFPYADNGHSYWTGYFTSRVELKRIVR